METVIAAFEREDTAQKFRGLLETAGGMKCLICTSGSQVRRALSAQQVYCVVAGVRLSDGPSEWLCADLPPACALLLVGPRHQLDLCASPDVFKLAVPIRREEAVNAVSLLCQYGRRVERLLRRRTDSDRELIDRAKAALMRRCDMSEEEAHRALQKRSMNSGCRLVQTARKILAGEEKERGKDG